MTSNGEDEADVAIITDPDVMVSDPSRSTCGRCGKRRLCTDYVMWGVPGVGITRCGPCEASVTGRSVLESEDIDIEENHAHRHPVT